MRATVAGLLVFVTACGAQSTFTQQQPVTTAALITLSSTTTVAATTTLGMDECPPEGGGQTRRGSFCPPDLPTIGVTGPSLFAPGTYQTRVFQPRIVFIREETFTSTGENGSGVVLDIPALGGFVVLLNVTAFSEPIDLEYMQSLASDSCADVQVSDQQILGFEALLLDITVGSGCLVVLPDTGTTFVGEGERARLYRLHAEPRELFLLVVSSAATFDQYFVDTVQPILDSVVFSND